MGFLDFLKSKPKEEAIPTFQSVTFEDLEFLRPMFAASTASKENIAPIVDRKLSGQSVSPEVREQMIQDQMERAQDILIRECAKLVPKQDVVSLKRLTGDDLKYDISGSYYNRIRQGNDIKKYL